MNVETIRIDEQATEGGLVSVDPRESSAATHLRDVLDELNAVTRMTRGELDAEDAGDVAILERFEINPDRLAEDNYEFGVEWLDSRALEIKRDPRRVTILLTVGGPHVELDILRDDDGIDELILRRFWGSARDRAWTDDPRATDIAADFIAALLAE